MNKKEINDKINKIKESINKIDINIYTNIGGEKTDAIPFTKSLFTPPPTSRIRLEEQPFFSTDYIIPYEILENGSRENKMNTLFNKEKFTQFIYKNATEVTELSTEKADENVKSLLKVLFPTYYPIKENHTDTYNELIKGASPAISGFSFTLPPSRKLFDVQHPPTINDDEQKTQPPQEDPINFTYLTIGGKVYTVIKVVYLNDFINNPKYSKIIDTYEEFVKLEELFDRKREWEEYNTKRELLEKLYNLFMNMNTTENICDYRSTFISQYDYNPNSQSSRYITTKNRNGNIATIVKAFSKIVFDNEQDITNTKNVIKEGEDTEECIKKYNDNNLKIKFQKKISFFNDLEIELKQISASTKENGIYNYIIRNIKLNDKQNETYDKYKKLINTQYKSYSDFLKLIDPIFVADGFSSDDRIKFPSAFKDGYPKISKLYKNVKLYTGLTNYKDNGYKDSDLIEVKDYIKEKYPDISKFTELIRTFTYPNRESFNKSFADMLLKYIQPIDKDLSVQSKDQNEITLPDFLKSIDDNLASNSIPQYNTGLDLYYTPPSGKSKYEVHVYMDLVEGKLTKEVLSKTTCFFKDNDLVNLFHNLKDKGIGTSDYVFTSKSPVVKVPDFTKLLPAKSGGKLHTVTRKYKKRKGVRRPSSRRRLRK
jgi:hypothetical protein